MKKLINTSFIYAIAAIVCGVFYREFTKFQGFSGRTTLSFLHVHLFVMGMILFLILALFCLHTDLESQKKFKQFYVLYNASLPLMVVMLIVRGIVQVLDVPLGKAANASISGVTGIVHIFMTIAIVFLFLALKKCAPAEKADK